MGTHHPGAILWINLNDGTTATFQSAQKASLAVGLINGPPN